LIETEYKDGSRNLIVDGERGKYDVKARKLEFLNLNIDECHSTSSIIYISGQAAVFFTTVEIKNSGHTTADMFSNTIDDVASGDFTAGF
jgi:hypothetical protein